MASSAGAADRAAASGSVVAELRAGDQQTNDNQIKPFLNLRNNGTESVPLDELTVRYWYTKEDARQQVLSCDWAQLGCDKIKGAFSGTLSLEEADNYLELKFENAGMLAPGSQSGMIQLRINKTDWSEYNESNDHSYRPYDNAFAAWDKVTVYRKGQLIWGVEPSALPMQTDQLIVESRSLNPNKTDNQISAAFQIKNTGKTEIPLSEVSIRYWYTADTSAAQKFNCDWAKLGCSNLQGTFGKVSGADAAGTATDYVEIKFKTGAGVLARGGNTGEIQTRLNKTDWSNYNEGNDYSYDGRNKFAANSKITVYRNGQLVGGSEPGGMNGMKIPVITNAEQDDAGLKLDWSAVTGADSYEIQRGEDNPETGEADYEIIATNVKGTSYVDQPVSHYLESYFVAYYKVTGVNGQGKSPESEPYEVKVASTDPIFDDKDEDGLTQQMEQALGTDDLLKDTDGDGLTDGEEYGITDTDPAKSDTDGNGISDGQDDQDGDGLSALQELTGGTEPTAADTDFDGLKDGAEISTYHTDPLTADTDQDGLDDGSEALRTDLFHTDPLKPDTDGDGILDGFEKVQQSLTSDDTGVEIGSGITFSLAMNASGDMSKTTMVEVDASAGESIGSKGILGKPIDIVTASAVSSPLLTFNYDPQQLNQIAAADLRVFYFNPSTMTLELVPNQTVDVSKHTVSAQLEHFSTYVLGDLKLWASTWNSDVRPINTESEIHSEPLDIVFVIDSSNSMGTNDPDNYRKLAVTELIEQRLYEDDAVGIVDLDLTSVLIQPLKLIGTDKAAAVAQFRSKLDTIGASGGTNIWSGLTKALDELEQSPIRSNGTDEVHSGKHIILVTDYNSGGPYGLHAVNYAPDAAFHQDLMARANDLGVTIDTFLLNAGTTVKDADKAMLQAIASETGGSYATLKEETIMEFIDHSYEELDKDTDGDQIPDKYEVQPCYIKGTMGLQWKPTSKTKADTDGDGLSDFEETGTHYYSPSTGKVYCTFEVIAQPATAQSAAAAKSGTAKKAAAASPSEVRMAALSVDSRAGTSDPNVSDTDRDGDKDSQDDKPRIAFKAPIIMIHGICSNSKTAWGADTYLTNFKLSEDQPFYRKSPTSPCYSYGSDGDEGSFNQDIMSRAMLTTTPTGYAYTKGTKIGLAQLDAQYLRFIPRKQDFKDYKLKQGGDVFQNTFANDFRERQLISNKDYFVFNWDAGNHVEYGGEQLLNYLKSLSDVYAPAKMEDRDITRYTSSGSKRQLAHYQLIGHSAGGLVSRMYIENLMTSSLPQIDTLVTIDTPHWGSNGHYAAGNHIGNPGACDTSLGPRVFADLDQDDSPLWYNQGEVKREMCGDGSTLDYNLTQSKKPSQTTYVFIGGLVTDNWGSATPSKSVFRDGPVVVPVSYQQGITEAQFHTKIQNLLQPYLEVPNENKCIVKVLLDCYDEFERGHVGEFGDYDVTVMSQFGIPAPKMVGKGRQPVKFDKGYLFVGTEDQVQHTFIEHKQIIMNKVWESLKR